MPVEVYHIQMTDKHLIVAPETKQDAVAIIDRLAAANPDMTIAEFLDKHCADEVLILR